MDELGQIYFDEADKVPAEDKQRLLEAQLAERRERDAELARLAEQLETLRGQGS